MSQRWVPYALTTYNKKKRSVGHVAFAIGILLMFHSLIRAILFRDIIRYSKTSLYLTFIDNPSQLFQAFVIPEWNMITEKSTDIVNLNKIDGSALSFAIFIESFIATLFVLYAVYFNFKVFQNIKRVELAKCFHYDQHTFSGYDMQIYKF